MRAGQTCGTCVFFSRFEGNPSEGDCRFNPPTAVGESGRRLPASVWPTVQLSWWCGQWEKQWDPTEPVPSPNRGCMSESPAGQGRPTLWCELMAGHDGVHRALRGAPDEVVWRDDPLALVCSSRHYDEGVETRCELVLGHGSPHRARVGTGGEVRW